ncbi:MAG: hypothetical protein EPN60_15095 [Nevskiaceae bacterium]|nr:MAG: hypothetical protein EPN60_15095 [Nevskiaceae bacterium]
MRQLALAADAAVVTQFQFHTHAVRVVARDGEPWFVLADVAEALGYRDAANAGRCLADKQRGTQIVSTPSGDQPMTLVNESGLYRLVLRSRKPEAIAFSDWVTGEVLPSIRKTGGYQQDTKAADTDKLRKAFALGADASAAVQQAVFEGVLAGAADPLWKFNRWLLAFAPDGKPYIKGIDHDEMIGSLSRITEMVSDHSLSPVTDAELANLASAGISRLAERIRRRNVEQAQERTA